MYQVKELLTEATDTYGFGDGDGEMPNVELCCNLLVEGVNDLLPAEYPFRLVVERSEGLHNTLRIWARDAAGNEQFPQTLPVVMAVIDALHGARYLYKCVRGDFTDPMPRVAAPAVRLFLRIEVRANLTLTV